MEKGTPIVDIHNLFKVETINHEDSEIKEIAGNFGQALHGNNGFTYLINHGIPQEMISASFLESRKFFELPNEMKMKYWKVNAFKNYHGYSSVGQERLNLSFNRELKEAYDIFGHDRYYPTQEVPWFQEANELLEAACWNLQAKLLKLLAISVKIDNVNLFNECAKNCTDRKVPSLNSTRVSYYPPVGDANRVGTIRCAPHTDYGLLSLLFQDDIGGLEVKTEKDEWIPAPPILGTIAVNTGDLLEKWTCGYFRATPHRVIIPESEVKLKKCRQSFISFSITDNHINITPLRSELLAKDHDFEPINSFEYAMGKAKVAYGV